VLVAFAGVGVDVVFAALGFFGQLKPWGHGRLSGGMTALAKGVFVGEDVEAGALTVEVLTGDGAEAELIFLGTSELFGALDAGLS